MPSHGCTFLVVALELLWNEVPTRLGCGSRSEGNMPATPASSTRPAIIPVSLSALPILS